MCKICECVHRSVPPIHAKLFYIIISNHLYFKLSTRSFIVFFFSFFHILLILLFGLFVLFLHTFVSNIQHLMPINIKYISFSFA